MRKYIVVVVVLAFMALFARLASKHTGTSGNAPTLVAPASIKTNAYTNADFQTNQTAGLFSKLKCRWSDLTGVEKDEFSSNFVARYKPALKKWCDAFSNRVPFSFESVGTNQFVERIGTRSFYREYIFVVDGITLGIEDKNGVARVDYLNAPKQTGKLSTLPTGGQAPISMAPIGKDEVIKMLAAESGQIFSPNEIRIIPSGYSGALNGGAIISVGGNPNNEASWDYDLVIGDDGKLAYYMRPK